MKGKNPDMAKHGTSLVIWPSYIASVAVNSVSSKEQLLLTPQLYNENICLRVWIWKFAWKRVLAARCCDDSQLSINGRVHRWEVRVYNATRSDKNFHILAVSNYKLAPISIPTSHRYQCAHYACAFCACVLVCMMLYCALHNFAMHLSVAWCVSLHTHIHIHIYAIVNNIIIIIINGRYRFLRKDINFRCVRSADLFH